MLSSWAILYYKLVSIPILEYAKNLGLIIASKLKERFKEHIAQRTRKAYMALKKFYPHRSYFSKDIKTI